MQGRVGLLLAGAALAVGGGVAGAVVVAPTLVDQSGGTEVAYFDRAGKEQRATPKHTFQVAKKARGMARGVRQIVNSLIPQVDQALNQSSNALNAANSANSRLDSLGIKGETVAGLATVSNPTGYERDPASPGPSVTVTVPESGFIEVWATVRFETDGAAALYEDGNLVALPGQEGFCTGGPPPDDALMATVSGAAPITLSTPPSLGLGLCGTAGEAPAPILVKRPPGTHTYELRYSECPCGGGPVEVTNRTLRIAARP